MKYQKLSVYNIDTTIKRINNPERMSKKKYAGYLNKWTKFDSEFHQHFHKLGRKAIGYQFAWKQSINPKTENYPDFNYQSNAMICVLQIFPMYGEKTPSGKKVPFKDGVKYTVNIRFDSIDDDIMYNFWADVDNYELAEKLLLQSKKAFEEGWKLSYPYCESVSDATYDTIKDLFEAAGGYQN